MNEPTDPSQTQLTKILQQLADQSAHYTPNLSESAPDQRRRLVRDAAEKISNLEPPGCWTQDSTGNWTHKLPTDETGAQQGIVRITNAIS